MELIWYIEAILKGKLLQTYFKRVLNPFYFVKKTISDIINIGEDNMNKLINDIKEYLPFNEQEQKDKELILKLIKEENILTRDNKYYHFTSSAWVVSPDFKKVLMVYHNIYNSWSWMGGHADGESDLLKVAIKEVKEESGLKHLEILSPNIFSLEVLCVDGHEKKGKYIPSHLHLNVTYLLMAEECDELAIKPDENSGVEWIDINYIDKRVTEEWMKKRIYFKLQQKIGDKNAQN